MKIIGLPDIHGDIKKIEKLSSKLAEVDLVLLAGDITNFGHNQQMSEMIELVRSINQQFITVPGNCDYPETEAIMTANKSNLNGVCRTINNIAFVGLGASLPTPFNGTPYEVPESYFQERLDAAAKELNPDSPMILVSHQPPYGTKADSLNNGMHVGSKIVRSFIEKHQPLICFTGHIHEGQGIDTIGNTQVINPGPVFKGNYAYAEVSNKVDVLEIRTIS